MASPPQRPEARQLPALEHVFKALADQTRLRILALLAQGEVCVCDIHGALGIPQPKASRHLAYLRRVGLVRDRKAGLWVHYSLAEPEDKVLKTVMSAVLHCLGHVAPPAGGARSAAPTAPVFACCGGSQPRTRAGGPHETAEKKCC
jgi:ArsR family transcriptional regulator, arsenate/arsenite/antimonite-responsive transcriptional repressor